jgi:hypothetical protein
MIRIFLRGMVDDSQFACLAPSFLLYHGAKEVPTGTCNAILTAAGIKKK